MLHLEPCLDRSLLWLALDVVTWIEDYYLLQDRHGLKTEISELALVYLENWELNWN